MLKAYVGIARRDGLVCFLPDVEQWTRFIAGQKASFWAVLSVDAAELVQREMAAGERFLAMQVLDGMASEILPLTEVAPRYARLHQAREELLGGIG